MKNRQTYLLLMAILVVLLFVLLWVRTDKPEQISLASSIHTNIAPPNNNKVAVSNNVSRTNATSLKTENQTSNLKRPYLGTKEERMMEILSTYNDVPIDFHGIVKDQFGMPVTNATINFSVQVYNGRESTVKRGKVLTDGNGNFSITGYKGESLGFSVAMSGYTLATSGTLFKYSRLEEHPYVSDANNPVVIKMWKLQGSEPLAGINKTFKIPYTSEPIYFDLISGQIVPNGGDWKITVHRPQGLISGRNPQPWNIVFEVMNGGFISTSQGEARVTYAAPVSGYQTSGTFEKNNGPTWVDKMFFIQSRNGQVYSKIHMLFEINAKPADFMNVTFNGVANTNYSRNWEATVPQ